MDIREKILGAFQTEHREHVEGIRSILASLSECQSQANDPRWDEAFRMAHTLKGGARVCELGDVESLSHRMESLFACVREGKLGYTVRIGETLNRALDAIEDWMAQLGSGQAPSTPEEALAAIEGHLADARRQTAHDETQPGSESLSAVTPVSTAACAAAATPEVAPEKLPAAPHADENSPPLGGAPLHEIETLRVETRHLDGVLRSSDGLFAVTTGCDEVQRELVELSAQIAGAGRHCAALCKTEASTLRKMNSTPGYENIARFVEQLPLQLRRLARQQRLAHDAHRAAAWTLRVVSEELRTSVLQTRMVTVGAVWQGLRQMMRSLAQSEGKEVTFCADGLDSRADRMVLQQLKDPLIHILRNAIVHGVEPPDERASKGKPPAASVKLTVRTRGNQLNVLVEDDGRGIDLEHVARLARRRGLIGDEAFQAEGDEDKLTRFLFMPAFSTRTTVDELAGRGMGLSVVQEIVKRLRGSVRIGSRPVAGSCLELSVPLCVSAERVLIVSCADQKFALPIPAVEQLLHISTESVRNIDGRRMTLVQGDPLTLVDLPELIGWGAVPTSPQRDSHAVVVLRCGTQRIGAIVESLVAERETLIKDLDEVASATGKFVGAVLLEGDEVALVVDASQLALRDATPVSEQEVVKAAPVRQTPRILVVDDSFTTRTLERSILETNGFDVRVAVDGQEALTVLGSEPIDLVVSDVEMPRMDGLTLLRQLRSDSRYQALPLILVTSLDRAEDRQRGMELGANAYIVKRRFDHQTLLETIRRFL